MQRIYVDMDDVLCETAHGFLALLSRIHDRSIEYEEIVSFDLGRSFDLTRDEVDAFMERAHRDDVLLDLDPIPGSIETLHEWKHRGYRLEIVTGRPPSSEPISRAWLDRHGVPYETLTFLAKYAHLHPASDFERAKPLSELSRDDYCLAVEDSRDMARFLADTLALDVALLDRPWNRNGEEPLPGQVVRCRDWDDLRLRFPQP
ncbi:MAG: bifunctional metallophosphatase/5'-nucleotidase [Acidobacteriota bacterium]|nr:bifunctional metallophosphatase/5'-nucleotidase [Acidobacteriota bacterium]